jgi:hypothetical protein
MFLAGIIRWALACGWMLGTGLLGSAVFYGPMVVLCLVFGESVAQPAEIFLGTLVTPALMCFVLQLVCTRTRLSRLRATFYILLGIWVLGICWIRLYEYVAGYTVNWDIPFNPMLLLAAPFATFMFSAYVGFMGALLLTSVVLPIFAVVDWNWFNQGISRCPCIRLLKQ